MDAFICGQCRVTTLPRLVVDTICSRLQRPMGRRKGPILQEMCCDGISRKTAKDPATGWQLRKFVDPLKKYDPLSHGSCETTAGCSRSNNSRRDVTRKPRMARLPMYPQFKENWEDINTNGRHQTRLEDAIRKAWPYNEGIPMTYLNHL
ncbi:hypothetical protein NHX12_031136 [Muraenolepis orangiensis]|uniref:Uncharacterized protein n=1 Tax=Muraenolepis orangiensis TaxID=630683 RepID=A0A9Q0E9M2_9TELE|nr:hypothetical protein NHX12_031136 [Muraenolepis orangiensis]